MNLLLSLLIGSRRFAPFILLFSTFFLLFQLKSHPFFLPVQCDTEGHVGALAVTSKDLSTDQDWCIPLGLEILKKEIIAEFISIQGKDQRRSASSYPIDEYETENPILLVKVTSIVCVCVCVIA